MTKNSDGRRTGRKPSDDEISRMKADGYATPSEVAAEFGVARTTVYDWCRELTGTRLAEGGRLSVTKGANGAVWVHPSAVRAMRERRT